MAALFFTFILLGETRLFSLCLDAVTEFHSSEMAVHRLAAFALAADLDARGHMAQDDGGGRLVDLLSACASASRKGLFEIFIADAELAHSCGERIVYFQSSHDPHCRSGWDKVKCIHL